MRSLTKQEAAAIQAALGSETLSEEQLRLLADLIDCLGGVEEARATVAELAKLAKAA